MGIQCALLSVIFNHQHTQIFITVHHDQYVTSLL